jgi:oxidase EvaA
MNKSVGYNFLKSALTTENPFLSTENFIDWLEEKKRNVNHKITPIPLLALENWSFNPSSGNLEHDTGNFFLLKELKLKRIGE